MPPKSKIKPDGANDKAVAALLRKAYKKHGSQKKVADALGVSPSTVSTWIARLGLSEWTVLVSKDHQEDSPEEVRLAS